MGFLKRISHRIENLSATQWAIIFLILGFVAVVLGYINLYCTELCASLPALPIWLSNLTKDLYSNIAITLIGTAIAVLVIDHANERRAELAMKAQLIREMGHQTDNGVALRAVRELRAHGWLSDGSLRGVNFFKANLKNADLMGADLQGSNLLFANLCKANLSKANLQSANILCASFVGAYLYQTNLRDVEGISLDNKIFLDSFAPASVMHEATMPDGSRYDGRLNLELDLSDARTHGIDISASEAMASYYGITREQYEQGQVWYQENRVELEAVVAAQQNEADD